MGKTFYFIDGVQADKTSKRLMRRHVMKGKNAGKRVHRPSRLGLQAAQRHPEIIKNKNSVSSQSCGDPRQGECRSNWRDVFFTPLARSCETSFLAFPLPVEVSPDALKTINECECEYEYIDSIS